MLISCPKCHSIYEIPDDLIGKTGRNFRCQACANVWHAMRSDALGYEEEKESEPFIEPIPVSEPPLAVRKRGIHCACRHQVGEENALVV